MGKTLCSSCQQRRYFSVFFCFLSCPYFLIALFFLGLERVGFWGFGWMAEGINVTIILGHPASHCCPAQSGWIWNLGKKDEYSPTAKLGLIPEPNQSSRNGVRTQDLESSFQQGYVPVEGLSGYRRENLGSPQATLSSTALHQDIK